MTGVMTPGAGRYHSAGRVPLGAYVAKVRILTELGCCAERIAACTSAWWSASDR